MPDNKTIEVFSLERIRGRFNTIWHKMRYIDHSNSTAKVYPMANTPLGDMPRDARYTIQVAIDHLVSIDTWEYDDFLYAYRVWAAKSYRKWIRKPRWVEGGVVHITKGKYHLWDALDLKPNVTLTFDPDATLLYYQGEDPRVEDILR